MVSHHGSVGFLLGGDGVVVAAFLSGAVYSVECLVSLVFVRCFRSAGVIFFFYDQFCSHRRFIYCSAGVTGESVGIDLGTTYVSALIVDARELHSFACCDEYNSHSLLLCDFFQFSHASEFGRTIVWRSSPTTKETARRLRMSPLRKRNA